MQAPPDWIHRVVERLTHGGFALVEGVLPEHAVTELREEARARDARGLMQQAGIGRAMQRQVATHVRGDRIAWLEEGSAHRGERAYFAAVHALREALNRELMAGVVELEAHYAIYPPGARYARHVDRFNDDDARIVSLVLYLNEDWSEDCGGALRIYMSDEAHVDIAPAGGSLVAFASDRYAHEVLPASRERVAIAGWFRRRSGAFW